MNRVDQSLAAHFHASIHSKMTARQLCESLRPSLEQARDVVSHESTTVDASAKALKDLALGYCHASTAILEQMQDGAVALAGYKEPPLASQLAWKDNLLKASYSMFAAGALEGTQAFETGLGPRAYNLPSELEGGRNYMMLDGTVKELQDRARWVTHYAETARTGKGSTTNPDQLEYFQESLDGLDRHVPVASRGGGVSCGHINEVMRSAYEYGVHAGILHMQGTL